MNQGDTTFELVSKSQPKHGNSESQLENYDGEKGHLVFAKGDFVSWEVVIFAATLGAGGLFGLAGNFYANAAYASAHFWAAIGLVVATMAFVALVLNRRSARREKWVESCRVRMIAVRDKANEERNRRVE